MTAKARKPYRDTLSGWWIVHFRSDDLADDIHVTKRHVSDVVIPWCTGNIEGMVCHIHRSSVICEFEDAAMLAYMRFA